MPYTTWKNWGKRFREQVKERGETLGTVSERMECAESTVRSWTNGTREINLSDFFVLCEKAGVDPSHVLFNGAMVDAKIKQQVKELATLMDSVDVLPREFHRRKKPTKV